MYTPRLELSEIHQGRTFQVDNGSLILISLKENPSTGYRWIMHSYDARIVKFKGSNYSRESENRLGGGGVDTFTFEAQSSGTTNILLQLERNWDRNNRMNHFEVTLSVK